jgi:hypothetical protein
MIEDEAFQGNLEAFLLILPYDRWLVYVASKMPVGKRVLNFAGNFF